MILGPRWLAEDAETGRSRLFNANDQVRVEIEVALGRGILIIPLFVEGGRVPEIERLPKSIHRFIKCNGLPIRPDPDFSADMERLRARGLADLLTSAGRSKATPGSPARKGFFSKREELAEDEEDDSECEGEYEEEVEATESDEDVLELRRLMKLQISDWLDERIDGHWAVDARGRDIYRAGNLHFIKMLNRPSNWVRLNIKHSADADAVVLDVHDSDEISAALRVIKAEAKKGWEI